MVLAVGCNDNVGNEDISGFLPEPLSKLLIWTRPESIYVLLKGNDLFCSYSLKVNNSNAKPPIFQSLSDKMLIYVHNTLFQAKQDLSLVRFCIKFLFCFHKNNEKPPKAALFRN